MEDFGDEKCGTVLAHEDNTEFLNNNELLLGQINFINTLLSLNDLESNDYSKIIEKLNKDANTLEDINIIKVLINTLNTIKNRIDTRKEPQNKKANAGITPIICLIERVLRILKEKKSTPKSFNFRKSRKVSRKSKAPRKSRVARKSKAPRKSRKVSRKSRVARKSRK